MAERDLAAAVVAWLEAERWDVYQEVQTHQGSCVADIVAVRGGLVWAIEAKSALTFAVLRQAQAWPTHLRSVAVPAAMRSERYYANDATTPRGASKVRTRQRVEHRRPDREAAYRCATDYFQVGVLVVEPPIKDRYQDVPARVVEEAPAPLMRCFRERAAWLRGLLRPEHKTAAAAGSVGAAGRWTPYRATVDRVARLLRERPGLTLREIMDDVGEGHYASKSSARSGLRVALTQFETATFEARQDGQAVRYYLRGAAETASAAE